MSHRDRADLIEQTVNDIEQMLQERFGENDLLDIPKVMGKLLGKNFRDAGSLSQNGIGWAVDHAVAGQLGPCIEDYLHLHQHLVATGCTPTSPWNLGYADRYAAAYANEETFKSFAVCTQNFTYMVVIIVEKTLCQKALAEDKVVWVPAYSLHIRRCCNGHESQDPILVELPTLDFLGTSAKALAHPYFRYQDVRDQGYLISLTAETLKPNEWKCDRALGSLAALEYVTYDLASLVDHTRED